MSWSLIKVKGLNSYLVLRVLFSRSFLKILLLNPVVEIFLWGK